MGYGLESKSHILVVLRDSRYQHDVLHNSRFAVQNASALAKAGITHILSVTTDSIPYPYPGPEVKRLEIEDYPDVVRMNSG